MKNYKYINHNYQTMCSEKEKRTDFHFAVRLSVFLLYRVHRLNHQKNLLEK